jgi:hypothetical protein
MGRQTQQMCMRSGSGPSLDMMGHLQLSTDREPTEVVARQ